MTNLNPSSHLEFENPPIVEVVCGVTFKQIDSLLTPHFGMLWEKFRHNYPTCQEHALLEPVIENVGDSPQAMEVRFSDVPPLPRIWFLSSREDRVVQIQRDRFLHNWRKVQPEDEYPRFQNVLSTFENRLSIFESFLQETNLGNLDHIQYELAYVNAIPSGDGWANLTETGKVFPDFTWQNTPNRFLSTPEAFNWRMTFLMPENAGRLHVTIRSVLRADNQQSVILMELTARGINRNNSPRGIWDWFVIAHDSIVQGFSDLTSLAIQQNIWRKKDAINIM